MFNDLYQEEKLEPIIEDEWQAYEPWENEEEEVFNSEDLEYWEEERILKQHKTDIC